MRPYVHTFAPDIQRAHQGYQELVGNATKKTTGDQDARLTKWLADPANPIPVHAGPNEAGQDRGEVNWSLLTLMLVVCLANN